MPAEERVESAVGLVTALMAQRHASEAGRDGLADAAADLLPGLLADGVVRALVTMAALVEAAVTMAARVTGQPVDAVWQAVAQAARSKVGDG